MDLSIIIVNWNSKEYLRSCIASILATTRGIDFEIVVIDNASFDGCDQMLRQYYPQVRFIQSNQNLGFARANNVAFRESCGQYVLFLNPDTELVTPAVNIMFDYLQRLPNAGAVNCKLLNADKTVQTSCIQSFPTILNQLLDSDFLRALRPKSPLWGMAPLFSAENGPVRVEAVSGACMMIRREVFDRVGGFSSDYFMYGEDLDLCFKMQHAGFRNYHVGDAAIVHHGGGSSQQAMSNFSNLMMRESVSRFLRKFHGSLYNSCYRLALGGVAVMRLTFLGLFFPAWMVLGRAREWGAAFRKWFGIFGWGLGLARWTRQYEHPESATACPDGGVEKSCAGSAGN
jgi:GT2 family glycosyltransferase